MKINDLMKHVKFAKMPKNGQIRFGDIPQVARIFIISGLFLVVGSIVLAQTFPSVPGSGNPGCSVSGDVSGNCSTAQNIVKNTSAGIINITTNLPLTGTIMGLSVILGTVLVLGARQAGFV